MPFFIATAAFLITAYSVHAEFVGFEIGNGVTMRLLRAIEEPHYAAAGNPAMRTYEVHQSTNMFGINFPLEFSATQQDEGKMSLISGKVTLIRRTDRFVVPAEVGNVVGTPITSANSNQPRRSTVSASSFGFGSGVPITNAIQEVNFNTDKGFRLQAAGSAVGLVEVRVTFTNNTIKRTSLLYAGPIALRTPMTVETVETAGALFLVFALLSLAILIFRWLAEPRAAPNIAPTAVSGGSRGTGGPRSVT
jgi:hypothetical protein